MGTLSYGRADNSTHFDDRTLAHLQLVVAAKLRRGEGFFFTWQHPSVAGSGHSSIWIHSAIPLTFHYGVAGSPPINREWIEKLTLSANGASGLHMLTEPTVVAAISVPPVTQELGASTR
jgi:hypothetical protein